MRGCEPSGQQPRLATQLEQGRDTDAKPEFDQFVLEMLPGKGKKAREGGESKTAVGPTIQPPEQNFTLKLGTLEQFVYNKDGLQYPNTSKNNSNGELLKSFNTEGGKSSHVSVKNLLQEHRPLQEPKPMLLSLSRVESTCSPQGSLP